MPQRRLKVLGGSGGWILGLVVLPITIIYIVYFFPQRHLNLSIFSNSLFPLLVYCLQHLRSIIDKNPVLQAAVIGGGSSILLYCLHFIFYQLHSRILDILKSEITIHNSDPSYSAVVDFVTEKYLLESKGKMSNMQVATKKKKRTRKDWIAEWQGTQKNIVPEIELKPNDDSVRHSITYKGESIVFSRHKGQTILTGWDNKPMSLEHLKLSVWGTDKSILLDLVKEAVMASMVKEDEGLNVYVIGNNWMGAWEKATTKSYRSADSVIFDLNDAEEVIADARAFLGKSDWYQSMGIPYRRGYLLYGPPGNFYDQSLQ